MRLIMRISSLSARMRAFVIEDVGHANASVDTRVMLASVACALTNAVEEEYVH